MALETVILNVELAGAPYKILRELQVPTSLTLAQLHSVLQVVFEWNNSHLYEFRINNEIYSSKNDTEAKTDTLHLTENVKLSDIMLKAKQFIYEYDFGDSWIHLISVGKIEQTDVNDFIPICISAQGEAPFDDIGGMGGFENLLNLVQKKNLTQDEQELIKWTCLSKKELQELATYPIFTEDININILDFWEDIKAGRNV